MSIADKLTTIAENVPMVYDAGKQAEALRLADQWYDPMWTAIQRDGRSRDYSSTFRNPFWTDETFNPPYPLIPTQAANMFRDSGIKKSVKVSEIKFSRSESASYLFAYSSIEEIYHLDLSNVLSKNSGITHLFAGCENLRRIDKMYFPYDRECIYDGAFGGCTSLTTIVCKNEIFNSVNFFGCPLTKDSLISILEHLYDYSKESITKMLTLGKDNLNKLTNSEKAIATQKGWTLA